LEPKGRKFGHIATSVVGPHSSQILARVLPPIEAVSATAPHRISVRMRKMFPIGLQGQNETKASRLCRSKASDCQRQAMTTADPTVRQRYFRIAKLWREMADQAERKQAQALSVSKASQPLASASELSLLSTQRPLPNSKILDFKKAK
jgi:hypothetical protein